MKPIKIAVFALAAAVLLSGCVQTDMAEPTPAKTPETTPAATATVAPLPTEELSSSVVFTAMETGVPLDADVDGDGFTETLLLSEEPDEDAVFENAVFLTITKGGKAEKTKVSNGLFFSAYYMEAAGEKGLAVTGTFENDVQLVNIGRFEGTAVKRFSETYGGILTAEDGGAVTLLSRLYALGTWSVEIEYQMTAEFELIPVENREWTVYGCDYPLTVTKPLPIKRETDACAFVEETLPVGTRIWLIASDGETYVRFVLEDNSEGILPFVIKDGIATLVDGTPDSEWLEDIIYAG